MGVFVADFETTTKKDDCRVWAWAAVDLDNFDNIITGTNISEFMGFCSTKENHRILFHNLKFDGQFIINWLLDAGYRHTVDPADRKTGTFQTLINSDGLFYQIEIIWYKKGKNINKVTFWDSYKLIPLSVEKIADAFRLPMKKLSIDYSAHDDLPPDTPLTPAEREYLLHDILIVAAGVKQFYSLGYNRMTIGSCAFNDYKKSLKRRTFERLFPVLDKDCFRDLKQAFRGGWCYLDPELAGKELGAGIVLDCNSIYPDRMKNCLLPWGRPVFFKGQYKPDPSYPLYTQAIRCGFDLKPGKLPTVQLKFAYNYHAAEYMTTSDGEETILILNNIDLQLFFENYNVYNVEYLSGWKYRGDHGLFDVYVGKWTNIKITAKKDENWGVYLLAKLFLNALFGKFGTNQKHRSKAPVFDPETGSVKYTTLDQEYSDGVYLPIASFVTSYAREKTIRAAQKIVDDYNAGRSNIRFIYADTDSLHCLSPDHTIPAGLDIDPYRLGAWKWEGKFTKAKFIRQKCYMEHFTAAVEDPAPIYADKITIAGLPEECKSQVNFNNFKVGATYTGKLKPVAAPGGVVLEDVNFTIKG